MNIASRFLPTLSVAICIAVSTTGCHLPVTKLVPEFSPLNQLSAGSHGFACCSTGECTASKLHQQGQPLPGAGQIPVASPSEVNSVSSLFSSDRKTNTKRGIFSCGTDSRQPVQIRSQNQSPVFQQNAASQPLPQQGSDGLARVSPATANQAAPFGYPPPAYAPPAFNTTPGLVQQTGAVSFSSSERRLPISATGQVVYEADADPFLGKPHEQHPDEYLLDGGDREHPVHYQGQYRDGLETEDTVTEYIDHTGKPHVKATNRVAIYAPRFASVRAITTPSGDTAVNRLAGMQETKRDSGVSNRVGPQRYIDSQRLGGVRVRSRASGVNAREGQFGTVNVASLNSHEQLLNTFEDLSYFLRGEILQANEARLAAGIEAAAAWTRDQNPVLIAQLDSLHEVTAKFRLAEIVGVEDPRKEPGRLEIVKVANRSTAKPGDIVTFAIRYENKGEREVTDVRIVDNLTPRLEYIEDSATSDRDGDIILQDNEEGSQVLTFKLDEPLKEKTSGVVTFQCRVR